MKKRKQILALVLAAAVGITAVPLGLGTSVKAEETKDLSYEGYKQVFVDEFDGTELDRTKWNVELHEPGWVNNELQEYVDSEENIKVHDGILELVPVEKVETTTTTGGKNLLSGVDFAGNFSDSWDETIANWENVAEATRSTANGSITYDITKPGTEDWNVQLKHNPITVNPGKTYRVSFKAVSTESRTICSGVMNGTTYAQHGQKFVYLTKDQEAAVSYDFTYTGEEADSNSIYYFSLGKMSGEDAIASKITLSDISLVELPDNLLSNPSFGNSMVDGVITKKVTSENMGANPWDVQVMEGVSLEAGKQYEVSFTASATVPRSIVAGVQKTSANYDQYGQSTVTLTSEPTVYTYLVDKAATDPSAGLYFNLGKMESGETPASTITIKDVSIR